MKLSTLLKAIDETTLFRIDEERESPLYYGETETVNIFDGRKEDMGEEIHALNQKKVKQIYGAFKYLNIVI
jgi:hypothetical protein